MALPQQDTFTRIDAVTLGANWTTRFGACWIVSNEAAGAGGGSNAADWTADAFNSDHYSQAVYPGGNYPGPMVRIQTDGSGYVPVNEGSVYRSDAGSLTLIGSGYGTDSVTDIKKMTAEGSTLKIYRNGSQVGSNIPDATYTGGAAGLFLYGSGRMDDWEGGNMGGGGPAFFPGPPRLVRQAVNRAATY